jgi:hypothetical protein
MALNFTAKTSKLGFYLVGISQIQISPQNLTFADKSKESISQSV